jgi:hypothetical protein
MERLLRHEVCDGSKRGQDVIRHLMDGPIAAHLETAAIDDHHFSIDVFEGSQAVVPVLLERSHTHCP